MLQIKIKKQICEFDKFVYINNIIIRSKSILQDNDFILLLNYKKDFMSIKNLKIINLKTLEITERDKNDYFTFFRCRIC